MGKTYRKQFGIKFIEGDKRAHRKLRHICRCDYCMGIRKTKRNKRIFRHIAQLVRALH